MPSQTGKTYSLTTLKFENWDRNGGTQSNTGETSDYVSRVDTSRWGAKLRFVCGGGVRTCVLCTFTSLGQTCRLNRRPALVDKNKE